MSDESDREFIEEAFRRPVVWVAPDELKRPTCSRASNLVIGMLASELLGNDDVELIGQFLTEYARFNTWFGTTSRTAGFKGNDEAALRAEMSHTVRRVYEPWRDLMVQGEKCGRKLSGTESQRAALSDALRTEVAALIRLRQGR